VAEYCDERVCLSVFKHKINSKINEGRRQVNPSITLPTILYELIQIHQTENNTYMAVSKADLTKMAPASVVLTESNSRRSCRDYHQLVVTCHKRTNQ